MPSPARVLVVDDSPTILKVVSAILARHGFEPAAARDGLLGIEMIKRGPRFDLVLLDFVMPRMNGYQFCRELRSLPEHKDLPVILMSAKGDKIRGQFVRQTGALDAITKPFDSKTLVSIIEGALSKMGDTHGRGAHEADAAHAAAAHSAQPAQQGLAAQSASTSDEAAPESLPPRSHSRYQRQRAVSELAQHIVTAVTPSIMALPAGERANEAAIVAAVGRAITGDVIASLAMKLKDLEPNDQGREVLGGDLSAIALAEILQILQMQRQTGILRIMNNRTIVAFAIRQGQVDLVQAIRASEEFRIGRYFIEKGLASRDQVEAIANARPTGQLLGEALAAAGLCSRDELTAALSQQSSELTYEVLRWSFGRFSFSREAPSPEADAAKLGLGVSGLVLEGFRRVDELRLMEATVHFDQIVMLDPPVLESVGPAELSRGEQMILSAVDGTRTIAEVIRESCVGSFEAVKILYQFLQSRVLRTRAA